MPNYIFGIRHFEIKRNITPTGLLEKNSSNLKLNTLGDIKTKKKKKDKCIISSASGTTHSDYVYIFNRTSSILFDHLYLPKLISIEKCKNVRKSHSVRT